MAKSNTHPGAPCLKYVYARLSGGCGSNERTKEQCRTRHHERSTRLILCSPGAEIGSHSEAKSIAKSVAPGCELLTLCFRYSCNPLRSDFPIPPKFNIDVEDNISDFSFALHCKLFALVVSPIANFESLSKRSMFFCRERGNP
jgi:hypothetical protein